MAAEGTLDVSTSLRAKGRATIRQMVAIAESKYKQNKFPGGHFVLIVDKHTHAIVSSLFTCAEQIELGMATMQFIENENRKPYESMAAVYFVCFTEACRVAQSIVDDFTMIRKDVAGEVAGCLKCLYAGITVPPFDARNYLDAHIFSATRLPHSAFTTLQASELLWDTLNDEPKALLTLVPCEFHYLPIDDVSYSLNHVDDLKAVFPMSSTADGGDGEASRALDELKWEDGLDWDENLRVCAKQLLNIVHSIAPRDMPHICHSSGRVATTIAKWLDEEAVAVRNGAQRSGDEDEWNSEVRVIVLDRTIDCVAPLVHDGGFEAALHDRLPLHYKREECAFEIVSAEELVIEGGGGGGGGAAAGISTDPNGRRFTYTVKAIVDGGTSTISGVHRHEITSPPHDPKEYDKDDVALFAGTKCRGAIKVETRLRDTFNAPQYSFESELAQIKEAAAKMQAKKEETMSDAEKEAARAAAAANPLAEVRLGGTSVELSPSNTKFVRLRDKICASGKQDGILQEIALMQSENAAQGKKVSALTKAFQDGSTGASKLLSLELRAFLETQAEVEGLMMLHNLMFGAPRHGVRPTAWSHDDVQNAAKLGLDIVLGNAGKVMKSAKTATAAVEAFYSPKNLDWSDGEARDHTIKQEVAVRLAALHGIAAIGSSEGFDVLGGTYREESIAVGNLMRCLREYGNGTGEGARPSKAMKSPHGLDRSEVAKVAATEQGRKTDLQYVPWMKHVVRAAILQDGKSFRDVGLAYRGEMPEPLCPLKGGSSGSGGGGGAATKQGGLRCKWGILCVCVCLNMKRWLWLWLLCLFAQCLPPCACRVALYVRVSFVVPCFAPHPQLHPVSLPLFSPLSPSRLHTHTHTSSSSSVGGLRLGGAAKAPTPPAGKTSAEVVPTRFIIFVAGGVTHSEMRCMRELMAENPGVRFIIIFEHD